MPHSSCNLGDDNDLCQFITPELTQGGYDIEVKAVDRATNESPPSTKVFRAGRTDVVQNLRVDVPVFDNTVNTENPSFLWNPPIFVPNELKTYVVAITGDLSLVQPFNIPFTAFTGDKFLVECFDGTGSPIGAGGVCAGDLQETDRIQITVNVVVPDGTHRLGVRVVDDLDELHEVVELNFTVDTTAPGAPPLVSPDNNAFLNTSRPLLDWAASTGDVDSYRLQVTSGDFIIGPFAIDVVAKHPTTEFQPTGNLGDATYQWRVIASDRALNIATSVTRTFTVDTVSPRPPAGLVAPKDNEFINTNTPFFDWEPSTTGQVSTTDVFEYLLFVTSGDIVNGPFDIERVIPHPITDSQATEALTDATYQWRVVARDLALNTASSETRTFTVDTVAPRPPAGLIAPENEAFLNTGSTSFRWEPSTTGDVTTRDVFVYLLQVTSGDIVNGPFAINVVIPHPTTQFTGDLADDTYRWRVIARDRALNTASSKTRTFTVDTIDPGVPPLVEPAADAFLKTSTPFFDWEPSTTGVLTTGDIFEYLLRVTSGDIDTGPFAIEVNLPHPATEFQATGDLADATYQWRVIARDKALNTASSETRTFTVDTVKPEPPAGRWSLPRTRPSSTPLPQSSIGDHPPLVR